jgi:hypothetical protein
LVAVSGFGVLSLPDDDCDSAARFAAAALTFFLEAAGIVTD